jgi:hypothetical protein
LSRSTREKTNSEKKTKYLGIFRPTTASLTALEISQDKNSISSSTHTASFNFSSIIFSARAYRKSKVRGKGNQKERRKVGG